MKIWLSLPFLSSTDLCAVTIAAEDAGIAGLALSDHVCVPLSHASRYPYGSGGPVRLPAEVEHPDPLVAISALAAVTSAVRFMTSVLIAPLRHPIALAKATATAASMSGGRLDLGVGVGWLREEFEVLGLDHFDERGRVTDEMLPLLRRLWSGEAVGHRGRYFSFEEVAINPRPPGDVPIFIGGHSAPALRRCARFGDGWVGVNPTVEQLREILESLRRARQAAGTEDRPLEIRTGIKGTLSAERVAAVRALGVDALIVAPWQIGERRDSVFDQPVAALADALPDVVERLCAA